MNRMLEHLAALIEWYHKKPILMVLLFIPGFFLINAFVAILLYNWAWASGMAHWENKELPMIIAMKLIGAFTLFMIFLGCQIYMFRGEFYRVLKSFWPSNNNRRTSR